MTSTSDVREDSFGDADVRIDVDEATYQRPHAEYCRQVEHGYSHPFDTFVYNHCSNTHRVTINGEPADPDLGEHGDGVDQDSERVRGEER